MSNTLNEHEDNEDRIALVLGFSSAMRARDFEVALDFLIELNTDHRDYAIEALTLSKDNDTKLNALVKLFKPQIEWYDEYRAKELSGEVDDSYIYDCAYGECQDIYFDGVLSILSEYKNSIQ